MAKVNMSALKEDPPAKAGRMLMGYGVDGVAIYAPVTIPADCEVCTACQGTGRWDFLTCYDGFERHESCTCENCDGAGVVYSGEHQEEEE